MALIVKARKKKEKSPAKIDYRSAAVSIISYAANGVLLASKSKASDKALAEKIAKMAEKAAVRLRSIMESDPDMEAEASDVFVETGAAIASFDEITSELRSANADLPDPPAYNTSMSKEAVSDGSLCLGRTGFVVPEGSVVITPSRINANVDNARIVTNDHVKAGARVKGIVGKHISEEA